MTINLSLPLPPSSNICYGTDFKTKRRFKTKKYKDWEEEADIAYLTQKKFRISGDEWLEVTYIYHMTIYNKNGTIKRVDAENYIKATSDWIGSRVEGFEDSKIKKYNIEKIHSKEKKVEITIVELGKY